MKNTGDLVEIARELDAAEKSAEWLNSRLHVQPVPVVINGVEVRLGSGDLLIQIHKRISELRYALKSWVG